MPGMPFFFPIASSVSVCHKSGGPARTLDGQAHDERKTRISRLEIQRLLNLDVRRRP
jgi:hypothetical protein